MSRSEAAVTLSLADTKLFLSLVEVLSSLAEEVAFEISQEGSMKVVAMDPAKVAMIDFQLSQDGFLEFSAFRSLTLGISTRNLSLAMEDVKRTNRITIKGDEENIEFVIEGIPRRIFRFRNLEISLEEIPKIELEFPGKASVLPDPLSGAIADLSSISNYITFKLDQNVLELRDSDTGKRSIRLSRETGSLLDVSVSEEISVDFDSSYLSPIAKLIKVSSSVEVYMGSGMPLKMEMQTPLGGKIVFYLAPRV
ncbi:MAG: hypothetical protein QXU60_03580 [Sulfolobales archaeon]